MTHPHRMTPARRTLCAIAAATALNLPFGTIYAFSVFLKPMEALLHIGRAEMVSVFALASISLTVGMVLGPRLYHRVPPILLLLLSGAASALGLVLTAQAGTFAVFVIGYGLLFGLGAGICFIVLQQGVNQTITGKSGLINGFVVSLYPMGAMIGAPVFGWAIQGWGLRATLTGLATVLVVNTLIAAVLYRAANLRMHDATEAVGAAYEPRWDVFVRLFAVFFLAASAGLMVMSQAAGIVAAYGGSLAAALGITTFITGAIAAARIGGGWLVDKYTMPRVAVGAHLCSLTGAVLLTLYPSPLTTLPALAMIGMGYGFISGSTAGCISHYWHKNAFGRVAGQLYIAWCFAAVCLPLLSGWLFDRTQGYGTAVLIAAGGNVLGVLIALGLPRPGAPETVQVAGAAPARA